MSPFNLSSQNIHFIVPLFFRINANLILVVFVVLFGIVGDGKSSNIARCSRLSRSRHHVPHDQEERSEGLPGQHQWFVAVAVALLLLLHFVVVAVALCCCCCCTVVVSIGILFLNYQQRI